jgi:hypothetical protein
MYNGFGMLVKTALVQAVKTALVHTPKNITNNIGSHATNWQQKPSKTKRNNQAK